MFFLIKERGLVLLLLNWVGRNFATCLLYKFIKEVEYVNQVLSSVTMGARFTISR